MPGQYVGKTLEGACVAVEVVGERIVAVRPVAEAPEVLLAPPLVDLQQNGALGHSFNRLRDDPAGLPAVARHVRRHGVGRILATFTTCPFERQLENLAGFDVALKGDADLSRLYAGAFFEGIYISPEPGWRGAHDPAFIRDPSWEEWARLLEASGGRIRLFNVAPERPGALEAIRWARAAGVRVAMGHCAPAPEEIRAALEAGCDLVTHFGNGAAPMIHRHHNPFWTWLAEPRLALSLIGDGFHLPADLVRTALAAKPLDKVFFVSDASAYSGSPPGDYGRFTIAENRRLVLKGEDVLAGNWFQADRCVEFLCEIGLSLEDAWRRQSEVPARVMGLELPRIAPDEPAEFVLARWTGEELVLEQAVSLGEEILEAPITPRTV